MDAKRILVFETIDFWNRPVFKQIDTELRFGSVEILFDYNTPGDKVLEKITESDIVFFGTSIDDDPDGRPIKPDRIELKAKL